MTINLQGILLALCVVAVSGSSKPGPAIAQNVNVSTPLTSVSDSYYENFGVNFGFSIPGGRGNGSRIVGLGPQGQLMPNLVFFQNGSGGTIPPFGGYTPNSGANFGFGRSGPNGSYSLGFNLAKGSTRTSTTVAPSLTVQNGFGGSLIHGQTRPFVTGVVPVVGGAVPGFGTVTPGYGLNPGYRDIAPVDNGVTRALQSGQLKLGSRQEVERPVQSRTATFSNSRSSALRGDSSVAQIKAERKRRMAQRQRQFESILSEAKQLESEERHAEARVKYREASKLTDDKAVKGQLNRLIQASRLKK